MFKTITKSGFVAFSLFFSLLSVQSFALTPEERGLQIAQESDRRDLGFEDAIADITMILRDKYGNERPRYMRTRTLEVKGDGDKSIIIFDNPGDVKGTSFLSFTHKVGSDDQWLYLPRLGKVKRISSSNKAGAFMNSEFAFEDIASQEIEKYTYKYLVDEKVDGIDCFVLESDPVDPKSGYSKIKTWMDKERYVPIKIEFFDRGGNHKKTLTYSEYNQYLEKYWRAHKWEMENHQTGKSTELQMVNWQFKTGLTDKDFNKNSLSRVK
ncbi:outer membrane lipoprotein-sorting protein [Teredinibacter sp. KSP-S5-2]|uniref:outer membrane lipoprotein-sorting protein n=1 Tax=Teredinibacter sp. KSP-S5-2 TaxID=3034506 RepID=UPI0029343246|nr:outer membrane lipoprotein-sorting protein [Teredinibacter sp. KSP-S5-2]WNO07513.1 outer membrane lipoprotein-sorting protein [Teredinibacter sp. KSP-S5-2]